MPSASLLRPFLCALGLQLFVALVVGYGMEMRNRIATALIFAAIITGNSRH